MTHLSKRKFIICTITFSICLALPVTQAFSLSLEQIISRRQSIRSYTSGNISSTQLLEVLWAAYGYTNVTHKATYHRTTPVQEYPKVTFWQWSTPQKKNTFDYSLNIFASIKTIDENVTHGIFNNDSAQHQCYLRIKSLINPAEHRKTEHNDLQ